MSFSTGWKRRLAVLAASCALSRASSLQDALHLEQQGKLREAQAVLQSAVAELRRSNDTAELARALSESSRLDVSLGNYTQAIRAADEAIAVRLGSHAATNSEDYNTLGLANLNLGEYAKAIEYYAKALALDRRNRDVDAEIIRLNNIGNVHYFRGQYQDAYTAYQEAAQLVRDSPGKPWTVERRHLTAANLAALYQRLGLEQQALDLYRELTGEGSALKGAESAQLLLNEGVLYRRLGDPIKAIEQYKRAQTAFAEEHIRAGEIGAMRNIAIARMTDLGDSEGALAGFTRALELSRQSGDTRGVVQASLYRGETERRMGLEKQARQDLDAALADAEKAGMTEEAWKSEFGLGQLAEAEHDSGRAAALYEKAIERIESIRTGIRRPALRSDFLADKRDPYDAAIHLLLEDGDAAPETLFSLMERSRARSMEERRRSGSAREMTLTEVQAALPADTILVEYWTSRNGAAALWMSRTAAGVVRMTGGSGLERDVVALGRSLQSEGEAWKTLSEGLGRRLMSGISEAAHYLIAADGALLTLPFETLRHPETHRLVIEDSSVTYLPAARFVGGMQPQSRTGRFPWQTELVAYGNPPMTGGLMPDDVDGWQRLPAAADEMKSIGGEMPGRSEIHQAADARKHDLLVRDFGGVSLLHFATHAALDPENADRSRIAMASETGTADYLFEEEIYGLHLSGVDLVTLSACETAEGPVVRGDGVRAFGQAFLAAGAAATTASLWRVGDRPTAELMKQFYYFLARGEPKAEALREAKLELLRSGSRLAHPRYWSAFVLYGDGWNACARYVSWSWILGGGSAIALIAAWLVTRRARTN